MVTRQRTTVFFYPRTITFQNTLYPFWTSSHRKEFRFTQNLNWVLKKDRNPALIMVGQLRGRRNTGFLEKLRNKYETLVYLDDNAGAECHHLDRLQFFDRFYKKHIYRDTGDYLRQHRFYGNRIYSHFYHQEMGVVEAGVQEGRVKELPRVKDAADLGKLRMGWNLGLGPRPSSRLRTRLSYGLFLLAGSRGASILQRQLVLDHDPPRPKMKLCHARFGSGTKRYSVDYQRQLFSETVKGNPLFMSGRVPKKQYDREIGNVQAVLSPFGWGEVCFRDFEAVLNGCVLVKPSMEHLDTWPNIYRADETYLPVKWDGSDLVERVEHLLNDEDRMEYLRNNAWRELKTAHAEKERRVEALLGEAQCLA